MIDECQEAALRRYVYGPGEDEPLVWYEEAGTGDKRDDGRPVPRTGLRSMRCFPPSSLHADERGSVVAVSDAGGVVTNIDSYDDYGMPNAGNVGRFQYTGQAWLGEVGLQYSRARIYSPTLGRFLQTDPISYGDGLNWYNYVGSDPVNRVDPSGLACQAVTKTERVKDAETGEIVEVPTVVVTAGCGGGGGGSFGGGYFGGFFSGGNSGARFAAADDAIGAAGAMTAPQNGDGEEVVVQARYLRRAVIKAVSQACGGCRFDQRNFVALSPSFVGVVDPNRLPRIFRRSLSSHAKASSSAIPGSGYELKLYLGDTANNGANTITITTPLTDPRHYIDFPFYVMGDPVNSYYARQYCLGAGGC